MLKQVIIIRTDLGLSPGKIAAQVAHASLLSFLESCHKNEDTFKLSNISDLWLSGYYKKIVLKVDTLEKLLKLSEKAKSLGLPTSLIMDVGFNELNGMEYTALGVGPAEECDLEFLKRVRVL